MARRTRAGREEADHWLTAARLPLGGVRFLGFDGDRTRHLQQPPPVSQLPPTRPHNPKYLSNHVATGEETMQTIRAVTDQFAEAPLRYRVR